MFASVQRWFPPVASTGYCRFLLAGAFVLRRVASPRDWGSAYSLRARGSRLLGPPPLTISFGQGELMGMGARRAVIASYQLGYGIAALGAGPLRRTPASR